MREIKFRAWDKVLSKMVRENSDFDELKKARDEASEEEYSYSAYEADEWYPARDIHGIFDYFDTMYNNEEFNVMQYTGLLDKNGVEIYEGDIVNKYGTYSNFIIEFGEYKRPAFSNGDLPRCNYGFYCKGIPYISDMNNYNHESVSILEYTLEVIGNIYENPELINK